MKRSTLTRVLLGALGSAALFAACTNDRPTVSDPLATKAYGFGLSRDGRGLPPVTGTATFKRPQSTRNATRVDSTITLSFSGLDSLASGDYVVWLVTIDPATPNAFATTTKATGTLVLTRTDTTIDVATGDPVATKVVQTFTNVSAFRNGGPREAFTFTFAPPKTQLNSAVENRAVFISIEPSAATATTPSDVRPIYWRLSEGGAGTRATSATPGGPAGALDSVSTVVAPIHFGHFAANPDSQYVFVVNGRGRVAVFGNRLFLFDSTLSRPPRGYYYAVYGVRKDTVSNAVIDTVFLGELAAPKAGVGAELTSLRQADSLEVDPVVQKRPPSINAGYVEVRGDTLTTLNSLGSRYFRQFAEILVTLEPKLSRPNAASSYIVLSATVPDVVRLGRP